MATTRVKNRLESTLAPFAAHLPISPNVITLLAVLVMAGAAYEVIQNNFLIAAVLILLSGFLDVLDGTVAKAKGIASPFGALLDRVGDRASDALIFGSIILAGLVPLWLGLVVLVLVLLASYASACLEAFSKTRIGEALSLRAVRLVLLVASLLLASYAGSLLYIYTEYAFAIIGVLTAVALAQRLWVARKIVK